MTEFEEDPNEAELAEEGEGQEGKKGKKGEGEQGAPPARAAVAVTPAFFELMSRMGASKELVAEILRNWRHLKGEGLLKRVMDFARGLVKSSHIQVEIDKDKDFSVVHNFIQDAKKERAPEQKLEQHAAATTHKPRPDLSPHLTLKPK